MKYIKIMMGVVCGLLHFLFGEFDALLGALGAMLVIDYITGFSVAVCQKKLNSKVGAVGLIKKFVIILIVAVSKIAGHVLEVEWIRPVVIGFYLANEAISVLENAGKLGIGIPKKLLDVLEQLKKDNE